MMTAIQIIQTLGGVTKAARQLDIPITTVDTWRRKNAIPKWRMPAVDAALQRIANGSTPTLKTFHKIEDAVVASVKDRAAA